MSCKTLGFLDKKNNAQDNNEERECDNPDCLCNIRNEEEEKDFEEKRNDSGGSYYRF